MLALASLFAASVLVQETGLGQPPLSGEEQIRRLVEGAGGTVTLAGARDKGFLVVNLDGTRGESDEHARSLASSAGVGVLRMSQTNVTDVGLKYIGQMRGLRQLSLFGSSITDSGLKNLRHSIAIEKLNLGGTRVSGRGVEALKALPRLKVLLLHSAAVDDAGVRSVASLKTLTRLSLANTRITDRGVGSLAGLGNLEYLSLAHTAATFRCLNNLKELPHLIHLDLSCSRCSETDAGRWNWPARLKELNLSGTAISSKTLKTLGVLGDLRTLTVGETHIADRDLESLPTSVFFLDLRHTDISDSGIIHLASIRGLTEVNLSHTRISGATLSHLQKLRNLEAIDLENTAFSDQFIPELASIRTLKLASLSRSHVTSQGVGLLRKALPECQIVFGGEGKREEEKTSDPGVEQKKRGDNVPGRNGMH